MKRLYCIGDSNTYGYDPRSYLGSRYPESVRWTGILKQNGYDIINLGANGTCIPEKRDFPYYRRILSSYKKGDLCFVMLGTNDILQHADAERTTEKMKAFLEDLLSHEFSVVLGIPVILKQGAWVPAEELVDESIWLTEKYFVLAKNKGIPMADSRPWKVDLCFDGVHFTPEGHSAFAKGLMSVLEKL
ncbi:MAG: SGNH/GDSL hydrolase family protein [Solobacterium sp.]|nr:SGNH/GDSL hydrolase family protein [Solobacterium sp.]